MIEAAKEIGKPGGIRQLKDYYEILWHGSGASQTNIPATVIATTTTFGDPILKLSSGANYFVGIIPNWGYQATYISPNPTSLRLRVGSNGVADNIADIQRSHTEGSTPCDECPLLLIQDVIYFLLNTGERRFQIRVNDAGTAGRTVCLRQGSFRIIIKTVSGTVESVVDKEFGGGLTKTIYHA